MSEEKILSIDIKPGWKSGTKITFAKEGDETPGHLAGDIIFVIQVVGLLNYSIIEYTGDIITGGNGVAGLGTNCQNSICALKLVPLHDKSSSYVTMGVHFFLLFQIHPIFPFHQV